MNEDVHAKALATLNNEASDAVTEHGAAAVLWAYQTFLKPILPFMAQLFAENELLTHANDAGLTREQAKDALRLMGHLVKSAEQHDAWCAGEILLKNTGDMQQVLAAIAVPPSVKPA
jgi:hypothetical protein